MRPTDRRRLVILTEGQFGVHNAKTADGRDPLRPRRRRRGPRLDDRRAERARVAARPSTSRSSRRSTEALALPSPARRAADRDRPDRRPAARRRGGRRSSRRSTPASTSCPGLHTFLGDDPEFAAAAAARRAPRSSTTGGRRTGWRPPSGAATVPGKRVILTVGTDCAIGKMSVALELRAAARRGRRLGRLRPDRPDRDDDRGLGRRGRSGHQRLRPGHRRVAGRGGRGARRLGHRRGPGLARPPGLLVGDAGAHPRHDAARDGPRPQAGPRRARLRPPARGVVPDRAAARRSSTLHEQVAGLVAPSKVVAIALNTSLYPDRRRGAGRDRRGSRPRPACRPTTRSGSGPTGCGRPIRDARRRAAVGRVVSLSSATRSCTLDLRDPFVIARVGARRRATA